MFTIEEIQLAKQRMNSGADFPKFAAELKAMGVTRSDTYVINGMAIYFGQGDETVEGHPVYESLLIEPTVSVQEFKDALKANQQGETDFQTFCREAASSGVEKWITDLNAMTVTYLDAAGNEVLKENIPLQRIIVTNMLDK